MSLQTRAVMETRSNKLTLKTVPATQKGVPRSHSLSSTSNKISEKRRSVGGRHDVITRKGIFDLVALAACYCNIGRTAAPLCSNRK